MKNALVWRVLYSVLILSCSLSLYLLKEKDIPYIDQNTDSYFENISAKAVSAYAVTRGVNAVVSVVKESQVSVSPAGVGVTIAGGQILDPLDDMTEKLSNILVMSIVSIGIQKISMEIGKVISFEFISYLLPFLLLPIWLPGRMFGSLVVIIAKIILILFVLRFFLPTSMMVNDVFYNEFLEDNITQTKQKLKIISDSGDEISRFDTIDYDNGILESLNSSLDTVTKKAEQMRRLFNKIKMNLSDIIESLLDLTIYYSMLFIVQIILVPLLVFWITIKLVNALLQPQLRQLLQKNMPRREEPAEKAI